MDTEIPQSVLLHKRNKAILTVAVGILLFGAALWVFREFIRPTINRADISTAVVEKGDIENTISATGEVLPEFEEVLTSPIDASIKNVLLDAGSKVTAGQSVLLLDKASTETEYIKLKFQLESKQNEIDKLKLDLGKSFYDLKSNNDIKQLHIGNLTDAVENTKRLYTAGGGTREGIEQAELNLKVAQLEKKQLENEILNQQQTMQIQIKEAEIDYAIQKNDLAGLGRKLQLASIVTTRDGVVTWINKNIGTTVKEGESLARVSDLSSFKVTGSVSDNYLNQMHNGMAAIIRINDSSTRGHVVNVYPSIQNGIVTFDIQLDERHNKQLRPNMKVDVYLVTETHNQVLRVTNGPAFKGSSPQDIFVVHDHMAEKKSIHTGLSNFDYVELLDGVRPGDMVITSDMSDYKNTKNISIR
jgi:HlyD family secretion protein